MSRLIYRCWDSKLKKYADGPSNSNIDWNTAIPFQYYETHKHVFLQQCIGKQDRFGKWIFEGDILLLSIWDEYYSSVTVKLYLDDDLSWMIQDIKEGRGSWGTEGFIDYYEKENIAVIGNIYEGCMTDKEIQKMFEAEYPEEEDGE